jgi:hypothetical protein
MQYSSIDQQLAKHFSPYIVEPLQYGENAVLFWFPGTGMTTIVKDILADKPLLKKHLGKLADNLSIHEFWGHLSAKRTLAELLVSAGYNDEQELFKSCTSLLEKGYEQVYALGRIDNFPEKQKVLILKLFLKLISLNRRRVHLIFNSVDKPWFTKAVKQYPELLSLATRSNIVKGLSDKALESYIDHRAGDYGMAVSAELKTYASATYGGILLLVKEYLRANGDERNLGVKLRSVWDALPESYRDAIQARITGEAVRGEALEDLEKFGVAELTVFKQHKDILDISPEALLAPILTPGEKALWKYCGQNPGNLIDKDFATSLLRPDNAIDVSFWAVDKAISRFRNKLLKSGLDPESFKTVKGKGYIWNAA